MSNVNTLRVGGTDYAIEDPSKANASQIATIESGATASAAHVAGEFIYHSGTLYVVTAPISAGDTLTVGTNIQATTVGSELKTIKTDLSDYEVLPSKNLFYEIYNNRFVFGSDQTGYNINGNANGFVAIGKVAAGDYVISKNNVGNRFRVVLFKTYPKYTVSYTDAVQLIAEEDTGRTSYSFTVPSGYYYVAFGANRDTAYSGDIQPMLCTAADYAADPSYVPYWVCMRDGKLDIADYARTGAVNLFKMVAQSTTQSPISSVIDIDAQTATLSATAAVSTTKWFSLSGNFKLPQGRYFLSGSPKMAGVTCQLLLRDDPQDTFVAQDYGNGGVWFDVDATIAAKNLIMYIGVSCTAAFSNLVFKPMIATNDKMPFVTFAMTNRELTEVKDGAISYENGIGQQYALDVPLKKQGNVCMLSISLVGIVLSQGTWGSIGTLPVGFRPYKNVGGINVVKNASGDVFDCEAQAGGTLRIRNNSGAVTSTDIVHFNGVYYAP